MVTQGNWNVLHGKDNWNVVHDGKHNWNMVHGNSR